MATTTLPYGKYGDLTGADREDREISVLALHLLQSALVHVNTALIQRVAAGAGVGEQADRRGWRGLTPMFWTQGCG